MATNVENMISGRRADAPDVESRFQALVQSPLRAAILRFLCARPDESFDLEALMQTFGRMRLDVENCIRELAGFGLAQRSGGNQGPARYSFAQPESEAVRDILDHFLERRATVSHEDRSPAVQRFREMIGRDEKMLVVFEWIRTAAKSDISVLILGPTGSGKEVVARMIHELSRRGTNKFQAVNCAALPDTLFESEIFGYERGAFTGAHDRKPGRLELANNGTLFLDEIGDMSLIAQAKLLRVLEERRFERLGGTRTLDVDVRVLASSSVDLREAVQNGAFREDLYHRLSVVPLQLPPLRSRREDILPLAEAFLQRERERSGRRAGAFASDAREALAGYLWPGNVRELRGAVERAALLTDADTIPRSALPQGLLDSPQTLWEGRARLPTLRDVEQTYIRRVLEQSKGNQTRAAQVLGISRKALWEKRRRYGIP
jgi:DNA-binding NtrC family response regulator